MTKADEGRQLRLNKKLLDGMFSGGLPKIPKKDVEEYLYDLCYKLANVKRSKPYDHTALKKSIAKYLKSLGWEVGTEFPYKVDPDDVGHRFDIVAQKSASEIMVEVKTELDGRGLGQVQEYMFTLKRVSRKSRKVRVFLGTDLLSIAFLLDGYGSIADMIDLSARRLKLGLIFVVDKDIVAVVPAEFVPIFFAYWKRLQQ